MVDSVGNIGFASGCVEKPVSLGIDGQIPNNFLYLTFVRFQTHLLGPITESAETLCFTA